MQLKKEVKLAITAIAAVIILIWGINFLKAKALFDSNYTFYGVYDRVDGLKVSSSVVFRGYKIGQVNRIRFVGKRFDKVLVEFSIGKELEIPVNSVASIESADLMGSKSINILPGTSDLYAESGDTLATTIQLGLMEQINEQVLPLKDKAENIMNSLDTVLTVIQSIFNEGTKGNIQMSLRSVGRTLDNVESASANLDKLLTDGSSSISTILSNVNSITSNLEKNNDKVSKSLGNFTAITDSLREINVNHTIRSLNKVLGEVDSMVSKINQGKGTLGEVINNDDLYYNLTALSNNLNKLLIEFKANPKKFVNLSVFDFTSSKGAQESYGIAVYVADKPLALNSDMYIKYPELEEFMVHGKFIYIAGKFKKLKQAQKRLTDVNKYDKDAYIVKLP